MGELIMMKDNKFDNDDDYFQNEVYNDIEKGNLSSNKKTGDCQCSLCQIADVIEAEQDGMTERTYLINYLYNRMAHAETELEYMFMKKGEMEKSEFDAWLDKMAQRYRKESTEQFNEKINI